MALDFLRLRRHLARALRLRCPLCGESPLFCPWREVRTPVDWMTTLDGCRRCGYPYEREPGYFLIAIWGVNYFIAIAGGLALYLALSQVTALSLTARLWIILPSIAALSVLTVRHSKSIFLAVDRFLDP